MPLQTLAEYNEQVDAALSALPQIGVGIACPNCGAELYTATNVQPVSLVEPFFDKVVFCVAETPNHYTGTIRVLRD
jgi:hypothetical protein